MPDVTVTNLTYISFLVGTEIDQGGSAPIDEAEEALASRNTLDFLRDYIDPPENLDLEVINEQAVNRVFERYHPRDPSELGVTSNGLLYILMTIAEIVQNGDWVDESGREVDMSAVSLNLP